MELELPRRDSARPLPASEESSPASPGAPSLHMSSSPRMDSGPRELFGVGMGVAAVRMMIGGAIVPRGSTWPLAVIIREYIFSSAGGGEVSWVCLSVLVKHDPAGQLTGVPELLHLLVLLEVVGFLLVVRLRSVGVALATYTGQ